MSRSTDRISRRAALQGACTGALGAFAAAAAMPKQLRASVLAPSAAFGAASGAERLLMVFWRDPALTGADELAFFHGSTTRLEPSLGAWLVHALGPADPQVQGLQCVEWGPMTSTQRMAYAGGLPKCCHGAAKSIFHLPSEPGFGAQSVAQLGKEFDRGARVVQAIQPADQPFSVASFSRAQNAESSKCLLVLAGTRERIEASRKESLFPSDLSAPVQIAGSRLHVLLHGPAIQSRFAPEAQAQACAQIQQVRAADLHATVLAGMGLNARRLVHAHQGRSIRPLAAQGRAISGVYA